MSARASAREKAITGWGEPLPDWIDALAKACDAASLRSVSEKLDVSPALVSLALRNEHHSRLDYIQARVGSHLLVSIVPCPALGMIPHTECRARQAEAFSANNPLKAKVFRACRAGCKFFEQSKKEKTR